MKNKINAFTLVEILIGILIVTTVLIAWFQALSSVWKGKVKLIQETDLQKDAFLFSEKLFTMIKKGWVIDYEGYFDRKVSGSSYSSGHYQDASWYGNFGYGWNIGTTTYGAEFYYCRSGIGVANKISGSGGCVETNNYLSSTQTDIDFSNTPQRYGQYSFAFLDYNSNYNNDNGDENGDGSIKGDDDDEYTGFGPEIFPANSVQRELYLMSGDKRKRSYFRFSVKKDPYAPSASSCSIDNANVMTGSWCIGTIEVLFLEWRDWWMDHNPILNDATGNDGVIDTWIVSPALTAWSQVIAGSQSMEDFRVPLFPESIHVEDFKIFLYPNKDLDKAWKENTADSNISPYVRIWYTLSPSWKSRRNIAGKIRKIPFSTTINLTDIYSK